MQATAAGTASNVALTPPRKAPEVSAPTVEVDPLVMKTASLPPEAGISCRENSVSLGETDQREKEVSTS